MPRTARSSFRGGCSVPGESEYLLNGKLCRLRDIHDVLMGTGLSSDSYGIIGQERIGQLLSSKPHERRAIIEEAAGITRFKTKKHWRSCGWSRQSKTWRA